MMIDEKPKRQKTNYKVILMAVSLFVVMIIGFIVALFAVLSSVLQPITDAGNGFLEALRDEDYETAYTYLASHLQSQVESPKLLAGYMQEYDLQPQSWFFNQQSLRNNYGTLGGGITLKNGTDVGLAINLSLEGDKWRIVYFVIGQGGSPSL